MVSVPFEKEQAEETNSAMKKISQSELKYLEVTLKYLCRD